MKWKKESTVDIEAIAAERIEALQKENDRLVQLNADLMNQNGLRSKKIEELRKRGNTLQALLDATRKERDDLQGQLKAAKRANDSLVEEIKQLKAQATEAHSQFQERVKELGDGLDAYTAILKTTVDERDVARQEADYLRKRCQEAEERAVQLQEQIKVHEEVVERIRAQNCSFVEEQREAKKRAASLAADTARAREEVSRLVSLADNFKARLEDVKKEKNAIVEISNNFARERDELQAEYDARGKVIKKLRKRLHKLKKKLKH